MWYIYTDLVGGKPFRVIHLSNKVYIVTGSNTGIGKNRMSGYTQPHNALLPCKGYETALQLAKMKATVILACRSLDKARSARESILKVTSSPEKVGVAFILSQWTCVDDRLTY